MSGIYRYNDSILICCNQKLRTRYRFGRASVEYKTNLIKVEFTEENELLLRYETNQPSADRTSILCEWWLTASGLGPCYMVSVTRDNPSSEATLSSVYM